MSVSTNKPSTYHQFARVEANEQGGRFAKETEVRITGVPEYPKQPPNSPWAGPDPVPPEEPLGFRIDEMEAVGTPTEVNASLANSAPAGSCSPAVEPTEREQGSELGNNPVPAFLSEKKEEKGDDPL